MITDAEFWIEVRRNTSNGECIFSSMLALIHARQSAIDSHVTTTEREVYKLTAWGKKRRDEVTGRVLTSEEKQEMALEAKEKDAALREMGKPLEPNKAFWAGRPPEDTQAYGVSSSTMCVLQQVMMFAVPLYVLRYNVPAMSMSWNTSCFIDRQSKQLITFGSGHGVKVPQHLRCRGCVAGEGFFAILTSEDEVWSSGGLKVSSSSVDGPTALGREDAMTGIAGKTLMLVGHGQRLAIVTRAFTVRSLSALSNQTRSIIPSRHVRFLDLGYGEDYYMVGTDSTVYKTTASRRAVSTPRRVMTLCRTPVSRVASGMGFLLIIDQNGHLYTLGRNKKGQLGNGMVQDARRKPYLQDKLTHHYFVQVSAGDCHSLALASNGIVYGTGSNESGQLGLGRGLKQVCTFTPIPLGSNVRCIGIAAGPAGSMFYCENGQVLACGLNDSMQLGLETTEKIVYEATPITVLANGVESYTLDFGGFRRPEGNSIDALEGMSGAAGKNGGISTASPALGGSFSSKKVLTNQDQTELAVTNLSAKSEINVTDANNGDANLARKETVLLDENDNSEENHQPVEDAIPVHPSLSQNPKRSNQAQARLKNMGDNGNSDAATRRKKSTARKQRSQCACCTVT
ncbi:Regulator of chromosome condensation [Leishmania braziliensis]|nr:Regulator of chromosome condensation [Leishmania braziliensis]